MKFRVLIFGILLFSCISPKKGLKEYNLTGNKILGKWCALKRTADFRHLIFRQDGYVTFDCKIDTVFGLKYSIKGNYLSTSQTNKTIIKNKILKLTNDSLVFETLLDHKTKQVFYRCQ